MIGIVLGVFYRMTNKETTENIVEEGQKPVEKQTQIIHKVHNIDLMKQCDNRGEGSIKQPNVINNYKLFYDDV